ncbi:MAG: hypothetical protein SFY67_11435 [Candidatus Melainabacteria bacterium]|nr:hypothetical protein [Candidatus Melainabacteria bacterium]
MNNSFSFSFHENTPSWLESYYYQMNDSAATKKRLQSERAKHPLDQSCDTSISQEDYDNSLYYTFFSDDKVKHTRLVNKAAMKHWRHKEISPSERIEINQDPSASYQNLRAVLSGPGSAEPEAYEIDRETTYHPPASRLEEDNYSYGMGLDRSCLEVFLTESAKEKALHDYFLGKRQRPATTKTMNFGPGSILNLSQEQTVPDMKLFDQSLLASEVKARAALAKIINADHDQFERLADDVSCDVRMGLLENKKCPTEVIKRLSSDANPQVAMAAKERLNQ